MFKDIAKELFAFLEKLGIDPLYFATVLIIILHISFDYRNYKNWAKINDGQKFYVVVGLVTAIIFSLFSILKFIGVFQK